MRNKDLISRHGEFPGISRTTIPTSYFLLPTLKSGHLCRIKQRRSPANKGFRHKGVVKCPE
jgi:hypothetical protein